MLNLNLGILVTGPKFSARTRNIKNRQSGRGDEARPKAGPNWNYMRRAEFSMTFESLSMPLVRDSKDGAVRL